MNLQTETLSFRFLTPCFSGTAEGREASASELRVPAIRGHIRFWHRAAFGADSANRVWGSTNGNEGQGSRVAVMIKTGLAPSRQNAQLLPHKTHGQGSRPALPQDARASIELQRLPACTSDDWAKAVTSAKLWILAGTLGYRSSRAAGSVWPEENWTPQSKDGLAHLLAPLISRPIQPWGAALAGESAGKSWSDLRTAASDTPKGPPHLFGNAIPRKPSPVRFKVVELGSGLCLLAIAPSKKLIADAETVLKSKPDPHRWNDLGMWTPL